MKHYISAFKSNPKANWIFGIDGMPEESKQYRVNQDGEKLFKIMFLFGFVLECFLVCLSVGPLICANGILHP